VSVHYEGGGQVTSIVSGDSLSSQHATSAHFGLGDVNKVNSIEVLWPDGTRSEIDEPQVNQYHQVSVER